MPAPLNSGDLGNIRSADFEGAGFSGFKGFGDDDDNFFSDFSSGFGTTFGKVAGEVLPRWVASSVADQKNDVLFDPLFDPRFAGNTLGTQGTFAMAPATNFFKNNAVLLIGGAVAIVGLFFLTRN